jgi:hypothetical protein
MIKEATPAITPTTDIAVITPMTACLRLARRYRLAMKSSNLKEYRVQHGFSRATDQKKNGFSR